MEKVVSIDAKGRVVIPPDFREALGEHVIIRKTDEGVVLIPGTREDFVADFLRTVQAGPRRTGKPTNPSPAKMKSIWKEHS